MNTAGISKEAILESCRLVAAEQGIQALNMRTVAEQCGIALGSLYNYFPSKDALILETVSSIWYTILHIDTEQCSIISVPAYIEWLFTQLQKGTERFPGFFKTHSILFTGTGKIHGKSEMSKYTAHIKQSIVTALKQDPAIRAGVFSHRFSQDVFADFIFNNLVLLLQQNSESADVLIDAVERIVYEEYSV